MKTLKIKNGKKLSEVLYEAAEIIGAEKGKHWTRGTWFGKRDGESCYCAQGAILKAAGYKTHTGSGPQHVILREADRCFRDASTVTRAWKKYESVIAFASRKYGLPSLMGFNDSRNSRGGWREVRDALFLSAKVAEREEKAAA